MDHPHSHHRTFLDHPHAAIGATSPSTSGLPSSTNRSIHAKSHLIYLAQSPSMAARYTPRGASTCSRLIQRRWNWYARLKDASQMVGGRSRAAMRTMGCHCTMGVAEYKGYRVPGKTSPHLYVLRYVGCCCWLISSSSLETDVLYHLTGVST